jgi:hypothetical protein
MLRYVTFLGTDWQSKRAKVSDRQGKTPQGNVNIIIGKR